MVQITEVIFNLNWTEVTFKRNWRRLPSDLALFESAATRYRYIRLMRSAPAVNRTCHVGSVSYACYCWALSLTNLPAPAINFWSFFSNCREFVEIFKWKSSYDCDPDGSLRGGKMDDVWSTAGKLWLNATLPHLFCMIALRWKGVWKHLAYQRGVPFVNHTVYAEHFLLLQSA